MSGLKPHTVIRIGHICEILKSGPMNLDAMLDALKLVEQDITDGKMRATLLVMGPDDRKMAYILGWEKFSFGDIKKGENWRALYAIGDGKSAEKPRVSHSFTPAQQQVYRTKNEKRDADPLPVRRSGARVMVREYTDLPTGFFRSLT